LKHVALILIRAYQVVVSPWLPPACRFFPSCSHYGLMAFEAHGFFRGAWLTTGRILRCQPFSKGGYDPVPLP
jgi:putative membrane protein insertion efficiency factor